jgi:hypothetical protein
VNIHPDHAIALPGKFVVKSGSLAGLLDPALNALLYSNFYIDPLFHAVTIAIGFRFCK